MNILIEDSLSALTLEDHDLGNDYSTSISSTVTAARGSEADNNLDADWQELQPSSDDLLWKEFISSMHEQAQAVRYPKHLHRAHTHGHPLPRFFNIYTGEHCDNFGSDLHSWAEYDAGMEIYGQFVEPEPDSPTEDVFQELSKHLRKTQIIACGGEYLSRMVSLSGNLCWTAHRLCEVGKMADDDQVPGLAVFDVRRMQESGVHIWRVRDMLRFLDMSELKNSIDISSDVRRWASNADEYVCWDLVPREALVSFTCLSDLLQPFNSVERNLLGTNFANSVDLAAFRRYPRERIPLQDYVERVSKFIRSVARDGRRAEGGDRTHRGTGVLFPQSLRLGL